MARVVKYKAGMVISNWRIIRPYEKKGTYFVECVECGFQRPMDSARFPHIIRGKQKAKCKECSRREKEKEAEWRKEMHTHGRLRCSGQKYENSPERLAEIKEKYKNGVTAEILSEWLGR